MVYGYLLTTALIAAAAAPILMAQTMGGPVRPQIVGVASIRLKTNDLAAARTFYGKYLGYEDPFQLDTMAVFKVNDHQYIEVEPTLKAENEDRLIHIAFETTDAKQLRDYLAAKGVVVPTSVEPDHDGNLSFFIKDGDGHPVEFVQYMPGSLHSRNFGKAIGANRISDRMIHVGFTIQDRAAADRLFKEILGFRLQWYGGMKDDVAEWVSMRVPDGSDWLEYMLNQPHPSPKTLGVMNHMALGVPSAAAGGVPGRGDRLVRRNPADGALERPCADEAVGRPAGRRSVAILRLARPRVRIVGQGATPAMEPVSALRHAVAGQLTICGFLPSAHLDGSAACAHRAGHDSQQNAAGNHVRASGLLLHGRIAARYLRGLRKSRHVGARRWPDRRPGPAAGRRSDRSG